MLYCMLSILNIYQENDAYFAEPYSFMSKRSSALFRHSNKHDTSCNIIIDPIQPCYYAADRKVHSVYNLGVQSYRRKTCFSEGIFGFNPAYT